MAQCKCPLHGPLLHLQLFLARAATAAWELQRPHKVCLFLPGTAGARPVPLACVLLLCKDWALGAAAVPASVHPLHVWSMHARLHAWIATSKPCLRLPLLRRQFKAARCSSAMRTNGRPSSSRPPHSGSSGRLRCSRCGHPLTTTPSSLRQQWALALQQVRALPLPPANQRVLSLITSLLRCVSCQGKQALTRQRHP